jgi:hypothetical protein
MTERSGDRGDGWIGVRPGKTEGMAWRTDRRTLLRATLAAAAAGLVAACGDPSVAGRGSGPEEPTETSATAGSSPTGDGPRTIAVVGDSITFMSTDPLRRGLTDLGLDVTAIDAQVGRRMTVGTRGQLYSGVDVVTYIAAGDAPDLWVVALGTNDIGQYPDVAAYEQQVRAVLDAVPAGAPLAWVDTWHRDRLAQCQILNGVLQTVVGERASSVVVDWYSHGDDPGVVADDGVHPTPTGTEVFGLVVTGGVSGLLESL